MFVHERSKRLVLKLDNPHSVTSIIEGSTTVEVKGKLLTVVPHRMDVVRTLRRLGFKAPSPIRHYYSWPGRFRPRAHQIDTAEFCTLHPRAYVLNDMGTGKTVSVLWAYDYLRSIGELDWALVISPLSTLERTWADEVFRHFPGWSCGVVHGNKTRRLRVANETHDVYIINHDGVKDKDVIKTFATKTGTGLIIIDELAVFRNAQALRWKALNQLVNGDVRSGYKPKKWVWGLTGTPTPNEPTDAWAQCRLIRPDSVPRSFTSFRDMVMRQVGQYRWVPRPDANDKVQALMQPAIRFSRNECIDLPPTTVVDREAEMTDEQRKLYKQMLNQFRAEYEGGQITAVNEAVKLGKLLQIAIGCAYGAGGELVYVPNKPRLDVVMEVIEQSSSKVIVFVPLTGALNALTEELSKCYNVVTVHGQTPKHERDTIFHDFMQVNGPKVLVAQPATMAHGLSLTAADTIVWYAPTNSAEVYQQANARIVRPGQTKKTLIVRIQGSDVERHMYKRLERRESMQGTLLEMFKENGHGATC